MRAILQTYTAAELRKFISQSQIKGVTKMKKPELINEMVKPKHIASFKHIKAKGATPAKATAKATAKPDIRKSKPTAAVLKIKEQIKKQADKIKADRAKVKPAPAPKKTPLKTDKKRVKKPLTVTTSDGKKSILKMKPTKLKIPSITITEAPKEKKKKEKEIKSSLGKIATPKTKIRVAPKAKPAPKKKGRPDPEVQKRKLQEMIKKAGGKDEYLKQLSKTTKGKQGAKFKALAAFQPKKKEEPKKKGQSKPDCFKAHKDDVIIINKKNNRKYVVCKKLNVGSVRLVEITGMKNNGVNKFGNYEGEPMSFSFSTLKSLLKFDDKTIKKIVDYTGLKKEKFKQVEIKREKNKLSELGEKITIIFKSVPRSKDYDEDTEKKMKKLRDKLDYETRKKLMKTYMNQGLSDNDEFIFDFMKDDENLREIFLTKKKEEPKKANQQRKKM